MRYVIIALTISLIAAEAYSAEINLPAPSLKGAVSVEEALSKRRSIRSYTSDPLTIQDVSQILWAGQGITASGGRRTAPSAGAIYPLEIYLVAGNVSELSAGVYRYIPKRNVLTDVLKGDFRTKLAHAALMQPWVKDAPATIVFAVNYGMMSSYGDKGKMFADFEVGHAAQNLMLQAVALNLGTVAIGAFDGKTVGEMIRLPATHTVVYLVPVGHPR